MKRTNSNGYDPDAQRKAHRNAMRQALYLIIFIAAVALALYCGSVVFSPAY